MHKKQLIEKVRALAEPICGRFDVSLWDVSFEKEGRAHVLTVFIDRAQGGVFIEDCENVSRALDPLLDGREFDSLPSYTLSVSSAGLERKLTRDEHLRWALSREIKLTFYKEKAVTGLLESFDGKSLTLKTDEGSKEFTRDKIAGANAHFTFK